MDNTNTQPPQKQDLKVHIVAKSVTPRGEPIPLNEVAVLLNPGDDVAIARQPLSRGVILRLPAEVGTSELVEVRQRIPSGHKVALHNVEQGATYSTIWVYHRFCNAAGPRGRACTQS